MLLVSSPSAVNLEILQSDRLVCESELMCIAQAWDQKIGIEERQQLCDFRSR
jgi:hypothetical protein